jgi:antitoxin ParD1/3/4
VNKKLFERLVDSMGQMDEIVRGVRSPSREFHGDAAKVMEIPAITATEGAKSERTDGSRARPLLRALRTIKAQVEGGHYTNDSEYIRDLIRREQERGAEIEAVRAALIKGEKSGKPKRFGANAFKRKLRRAHG